jgi:hypothetical protein
MFASGLDSVSLRLDLAKFKGDLGYDPNAALSQLRVPVIWFFGSDDERVPVPESVAALMAFIRRDERDWTLVLYPGADHSLRARTREPPLPWFSTGDRRDWTISDRTSQVLGKPGDQLPWWVALEPWITRVVRRRS